MTVPVILEEISLLPEKEGVQALQPLQFVACGGGPLKVSVGERLATAGVKVLSHFGATEIGALAPIFAPSPSYDWHYFRLRQDMNVKTEPVESAEQGSVQYYKLTAHPFGWDTAFELQDRLLSNPENPKADFKAVGRNDDLIVLVTGEKVLPRILESLLSESQLVKTAAAFGDGQFELGVIVEPAEPSKDVEQFKSLIWPIILRAGDQMDDHARISSKTSIIVVPPGRSIPRSDKGSVLRKETYRSFEAEISKVYQDLDDSTTEASHYPLDAQNLEESLKKMIQFGLNWKASTENWNYDDDLFELGMNSLQALRLRRLLLSSISNDAFLSPAAKRVTIDFVYKNSSIAKIAEALRDGENLEGTQTVREKSIEDFIGLYSLRQPSSRDQQIAAPEAGSVVLLTGGTGSLGSHVLAQLASLPSVARVVCLNRLPVDVGHRREPREQQFKTAETKGITIPSQDRLKIEVIQTDPAAIRLGLEDACYARLRDTVTHILHCAWPMDFKRMLPSFQTQFCFLQSLLNLAKDAHEVRPSIRPRLLFISSIAVVGQYARVQGTRIVPEVPMEDSRCTNEFGYGKAKLVCEKMIENAARTHRNEMEVLCVRVGQVSGSRKSGFWNPNEHFPALIQFSQNVSRLPRIGGVSQQLRSWMSWPLLISTQTLSWAPVDSAAEALSELLLTPHPVNSIYHLENPVRQSWHDVLTTLAYKLDISSTEFLPFDEWMDRVSDFAADKGTKEDRSAAMMLAEFFKHDFQHMSGGNVILDTARARAISHTLRGMDAVEGELVASYVDQWRKMGFLA
jgi:thioester reductase-like protein